MTFKEICTKLGIPEYSEAIFNSNSRGELFHIYDYKDLADRLKGDPAVFVKCFKHYDAIAKSTWKRPESWYQHLSDGMLLAAIDLKCVPELIAIFPPGTLSALPSHEPSP